MNWEIIIQGLSALIVTLISTYQIINSLPKSRNKLKQDLEILKLLSPENENYKLVKKSIDNNILSIYERKKKKNKGILYINNYSKIDIITGIIFFFVGLVWTIYLSSQNELNMWIMVSIILVCGGLGLLIAGFGNIKSN